MRDRGCFYLQLLQLLTFSPDETNPPFLSLPPPSLSPHPPRSYDAATISQADAAKSEGNSHMTKKAYSAACKAYTTALKLCPKGPSSHIYYSNRAAASTYLQDYSSAESDCLRAISLSPKYSKAHARLGLARYYLEDWEGAIEAYEER